MWIAWGLLWASIAVLDPDMASQPGRSDEQLGVDAARAEMGKLSHLVGVFDLSATETASDGAYFTERGTRMCRWAFGHAAIQCEDTRTLEEATGHYERLPAHRRSMSLLRWNPSGSHYEEVELSPTGATDVRALTYHAPSAALTYESVVESSSRNLTLELASGMAISAHRHDLVQRLRSRTTDFQEEYRETALRRSWPMNFVGHWTSTATHYHRDGTTLVETGRVACRLVEPAVICERAYRGNRRSRIGMQVWTNPSDGTALQVTSLSPQSRVVQLATGTSEHTLLLAGAIPWRGGPARTRGRWENADGQLVYRNETEEAAGRWRLDYEERLTRF